MKCWINGEKCSVQTGKEGGLLAVNGFFCEECGVLSLAQEEVEEALEGIGIRLFEEPEEDLISVHHQCEIIDNLGLLIEALKFLKKKCKKQIAIAEDEEIEKLDGIKGLDNIIHLIDIMEILKAFKQNQS